MPKGATQAAPKVRKAPAPTKAIRPAPKPKKAAKPSVPLYSLSSKWDGESDVANRNVSRTKVDYTRFGTAPNARMTDRDQKALVALRSQFGTRQFARANVDAGILRRLGERGFIAHVSGGMEDAQALFRLTGKKAA